MPLPRSAYGGAWKTVGADGTGWDDTTAGDSVAGRLAVPAEHAAKDSSLLKVEGGAVVEKTQGDLGAILNAANKTALINLVLERQALLVVETHLTEQDNPETLALVQARLVELGSGLTTIKAALP